MLLKCLQNLRAIIGEIATKKIKSLQSRRKNIIKNAKYLAQKKIEKIFVFTRCPKKKFRNATKMS